jgi:hypothetical protein
MDPVISRESTMALDSSGTRFKLGIGPGDVGHEAAHEMHFAALPRGALEHTCKDVATL